MIGGFRAAVTKYAGAQDRDDAADAAGGRR